MNKCIASGIAGACMVLLLATISTTGTANADSPYCGIAWGSSTKVAKDTSSSLLTDIRTGRHNCYDRIVLDMSGPASGYDVRYVSAVYTEGQGTVVPLWGGAKLAVVVKAPDHNPATGKLTYRAVPGKPLPGINLSGYTTFRDAKYAGSFESQTTVGLGVRARLPFRVMQSANHVIIDVAHTW